MILDILILLPLGWGAYQGYSSGLLQEAVSFLHFVIAFLLSFKVVGLVFKILNAYLFVFEDKHYPEIVVATASIVSVVLLMTLGKYLKTEIEFDFPGAWDNIIGAIVGIIKYAIILSFFLWFINAFGRLNTDVVSKSILYSPIESIAFILIGVKGDPDLSEAIKRLM